MAKDICPRHQIRPNREVYLPTSHAVDVLQRVTAVVLTDGYISTPTRSPCAGGSRSTKFYIEYTEILHFVTIYGVPNECISLAFQTMTRTAIYLSCPRQVCQRYVCWHPGWVSQWREVSCINYVNFYPRLATRRRCCETKNADETTSLDNESRWTNKKTANMMLGTSKFTFLLSQSFRLETASPRIRYTTTGLTLWSPTAWCSGAN